MPTFKSSLKLQLTLGAMAVGVVLLLAQGGQIVINPLTYPSLGLDPLADLPLLDVGGLHVRFRHEAVQRRGDRGRVAPDRVASCF